MVVVKIITGNPTNTADLNLWQHRDSGRIARELDGTQLSLLHLDDSCAAWSSVRPPEMGPEPVPDAGAGFLNLFPMVGGLDAEGRRAWSYLNLICHALLISMGDLIPSEWRERRSG